MKIAVMGTGAMGGYIGARLARPFHFARRLFPEASAPTDGLHHLARSGTAIERAR